MIYLWLTRLLAPLLRWRAEPVAGPAGGSPRAVLLIQTAKIGDFVCTTPLLRELRRGWPAAELHLLIHPINAPLARHNPYTARVHLLPAGGLKGLSGRLWLWRLLRREAIDTTICVSPSLALWLMPLWAGVARRASVLPNYGGDSYRRAQRFLTHGEAHVAGRLLLETEFALLRQLGLTPASSAKEAWPAADAAAAAAALLAGAAAPLVGLGVSSGNKLKELGEDQLLQLAQGLLQGGIGTLVLVGGPDDRPLAQRLRRRLTAAGAGGAESGAGVVASATGQGESDASVAGSGAGTADSGVGIVGRIVDSVGALDLARLPALLGRLDAYVGVDSGITYLAEAAGVPVVDLMGPADADDQRPTDARAIVMRPALPCAPCSHAFRAPYACAIGTRACVREVAMALPVKAVLDLLKDSDALARNVSK